MQACLRIQRAQLNENFPVDRPLLHAHRFIHEYKQSAEDSLRLFLPGEYRDLATASNNLNPVWAVSPVGCPLMGCSPVGRHQHILWRISYPIRQSLETVAARSRFK